jgi:hypothetical protein
MIGKKTLLGYQFKLLVEYFDYIVNTAINGQHGQLSELLIKLSKEQKLEFYDWLIDSCVDPKLVNQLVKIMLK